MNPLVKREIYVKTCELHGILIIINFGGEVNCTDDLRVNRTWQFRGGKSYR